jgi:hypothetical protein
MTTDRYTKSHVDRHRRDARSPCGARRGGTGLPWTVGRSAEAQAVVAVPRDYGKLVGFLGSRAFFEAPDGTIRGVNVDATGAAPLVTIITRK